MSLDPPLEVPFHRDSLHLPWMAAVELQLRLVFGGLCAAPPGDMMIWGLTYQRWMASQAQSGSYAQHRLTLASPLSMQSGPKGSLWRVLEATKQKRGERRGRVGRGVREP